jgi:muconolactone D-isomerase
MEYLVTMTTHVPEGTPGTAVDDIRAREAAHTRELAARRHVLRLWALPGEGRSLGLWRARDEAGMAAILAALPLDAWMTEQATPLSPHPSDPGLASS